MNSYAIRPLAVLLLGILVASSSSILIRYAQQAGLHSLLIAFGRVSLAASLLWLLLGRSACNELRKHHDLGGLLKVLGWCALGGFALAVHFALWISSLQWTSVAMSSALVSTNPLWVGLVCWMLFGERLGKVAWAGIALSCFGTVSLLIPSDPPLLPNTLVVSPLSGWFEALSNIQVDPSSVELEGQSLGNVLALGGALAMSAYLVIGSRISNRITTPTYFLLINTGCAAVLAGFVLSSEPASQGLSQWIQQIFEWDERTLALNAWVGLACLIGLALGPQLMGHGSINWALGRLPTTLVAVAILGEPLGSAIWAYLIWQESVGPMEALGLVAIMGGIFLVARSTR